MAQSQCVRCAGTQFEAKAIAPIGSATTLVAIQCGACGGVVGVLDPHLQRNTLEALARIERRLGTNDPW